MKQNIRLMEIILTLEQGGAQQLLLYKLDYMKNEGYFVCVLTFEDGPLRAKLEQIGIPVEIIEPKRARILNFPYFLAELYRIQKQISHLVEKYDVNVVQTHLLSLYDFVVAYIRYRKPSINLLLWTFHNTKFEITNYDRFAVKVPIYRQFYRFFSRFCDGIVAVNQDVKTAIRNDFDFPDDKVHVIDNAVPIQSLRVTAKKDYLRKELFLSKDRNILMTIGRITRQKGHRYLLEALKLILESNIDVCLIIVGEGEDLPALQSYSKELGIDSDVKFIGKRDDIAELLTSATVLVFPSLWEGLSLALLEAMAVGKPIVATVVSGATQVIADKYNGRLVSPGNSADLATAVIDLLQDPEVAKRYGKCAYQTVRDDYDISRLCDDYIALYRRLLPASTERQ